MTIYESNTGLECPIQPMGNGKMLVYSSGISLWSMHCGYTSPSMLSLFPDFGGGYYESESERLPHGSSRRHRIWCTLEGVMNHHPGSGSQECDLLMNDYMAQEESVFLRVMEGKTSSRWKLAFPESVRHSAVTDYRLIYTEAHALFCRAPSENGAVCDAQLKEERYLTLFLLGDLAFEENGEEICFEGGKGYLLFIDSAEEGRSLKTADKLLKQLQDGIAPSEIPLFKAAEENWRDVLCEAEKLSRNAACELLSERSDLSEDRLSARLCDAAASLLALQSEEGFFLTDIRHPYATATDLPLITAALIKLRCFDAAWKMLDCWADTLGSSIDKGAVIPSLLGNRMQFASLGDGSDPSAAASFLLAMLLLIEADRMRISPERMERCYRKMKKAFVLTMSGFCDGMLPFMGGEACFEYGTLSRERYYQGSAIATVIAISAAERYFDFCDRSGRKPARESERYGVILQAAKEHFNIHFASDALYSLKALQMLEKTRRPRFIRGYCPICSTEGPSQAIDRLELDRSGHYRCRRCFNRPTLPSEESEQSSVPSIDAAASVALWMSDAFSEQAVKQAQTYYRILTEAECALPRRLGTSDAMLLTAAKRHHMDHALFRDVLLKTASFTEDPRIELGALPSAVADGYEMSGAMCSSASIAALIAALFE